MNKLFSSIAIASLVTSSVFAQTFNANIGTAQGVTPATNDSILSNVPLGFSFTFPDGTSTTTIDIDTNGRILLPDPANVSISTPSIADFTLGDPMICPLWEDIDFDPTDGDIYVENSSGTECTITWCEAKLFGTNLSTLFTFQAQLRSDNSVAFVYEEDIIADGWITGVSAGLAAVDPGESDLSLGFMSAGSPTVYEEYNDFSLRFDLIGQGLLFTPDGIGGYNATVNQVPGVVPCGAERFGKPCPISFQFFPDGAGGYTVLRGPSQFIVDDATAIEFGTGLGDDANAGPIAIGFPFQFPGPTPPVTDIFADNNGRIMADNTDPGDFNPSPAELLSGPATISGWWTDLSAQRGSLRAWQGPGMTAITWENVPKFAENVTHTFQIVLHASGQFDLNYLDVSGWQTQARFTSDDVLIGCSPGGGHADPGSSDFSNAAQISAGEPAIYEYWDASNGGTPDIHTKLEVVSAPFGGTNFEANITGLSSAAAGATLLFGFTALDAPLDILPLGLEGCSLYTDPLINIPLAITGSTANFSLPITANPALRGLALIIQGAAFAPDTNGGLVLTNAVRGSVQ